MNSGYPYFQETAMVHNNMQKGSRKVHSHLKHLLSGMLVFLTIAGSDAAGRGSLFGSSSSSSLESQRFASKEWDVVRNLAILISHKAEVTI